MSLKESKIQALISLLDDPDDRIYTDIRDQLFILGPSVIPFLESAWEKAFDPILQQRVENLIHDIQFNKVKKELSDWIKGGCKSIVEGALFVANYQYPELNRSQVYDALEEIRSDIWLELNNNLTAIETVKVINHLLFDVCGFSGNTTNFHAPHNNYINHALESKKGNPLMLSVIYMHLANELNLPILGVNLPEHFVLAYMNPFSSGDITDENNILFYINPFSKGSIFSKKEIETFLKQLKIEETQQFYLPCSNRDMIQRMLRNLAYAFEKQGQPEKKAEIEQLLEVFT